MIEDLSEWLEWNREVFIAAAVEHECTLLVGRLGCLRRESGLADARLASHKYCASPPAR